MMFTYLWNYFVDVKPYTRKGRAYTPKKLICGRVLVDGLLLCTYKRGHEDGSLAHSFTVSIFRDAFLIFLLFNKYCTVSYFGNITNKNKKGRVLPSGYLQISQKRTLEICVRPRTARQLFEKRDKLKEKNAKYSALMLSEIYSLYGGRIHMQKWYNINIFISILILCWWFGEMLVVL